MTDAPASHPTTPAPAPAGGTSAPAKDYPWNADPATLPGPFIGWPRRIISWLLMAVAGATDAIAFILFAGVYVSFMSGDATQTGLLFGQWHLDKVLAVIAAQLLFILGAALGQVVQVATKRRRRTVVLLGVAVLLAIAAFAGFSGGEQTGVTGIRILAYVCAIVAMGSMNSVMHQEAGVPVGTMVTGTLVRLGESIVERLRGRRVGALDNLGQWIFFMGGAAIGAVAYAGIHSLAFLLPAVVALIMAFVILGRRELTMRNGAGVSSAQ